MLDRMILKKEIDIKELKKKISSSCELNLLMINSALNKRLQKLKKDSNKTQSQIKKLAGKCHYLRWGFSAGTTIGIAYATWKNSFSIPELTKWPSIIVASTAGIFSIYKARQAYVNDKKRKQHEKNKIIDEELRDTLIKLQANELDPTLEQ
jgi:hypothetical protein